MIEEVAAGVATAAILAASTAAPKVFRRASAAMACRRQGHDWEPKGVFAPRGSSPLRVEQTCLRNPKHRRTAKMVLNRTVTAALNDRR